MDLAFDEAVAKEWVDAWNRRDVDGLLSLYTEDVEFQSPLVARLLNEPSGIVRGKAELRHFLEVVLATFAGDPGVAVIGRYRGVGSRLIHFEAKGRKGVELMELDGYGKIRRATTLGEA